MLCVTIYLNILDLFKLRLFIFSLLLFSTGTGELNTYEKLVIGVAASCLILLLIYVFIIITIATTRKSKKQRLVLHNTNI